MSDSIMMALLGGGLIGLAASLLFLSMGRISGISGIVGGLFSGWTPDSRWRLAFLSGLMVGGAILVATAPAAIRSPSGRSLAALAIAGGLVGVGTRLGNGCTSGHGVCGLSRLSPRSIAATLTFMATGFATATFIGLSAGGAP